MEEPKKEYVSYYPDHLPPDNEPACPSCSEPIFPCVVIQPTTGTDHYGYWCDICMTFCTQEDLD